MTWGITPESLTAGGVAALLCVLAYMLGLRPLLRSFDKWIGLK